MAPNEAGSIVVETCPGCAAHLKDTWTGSECERCGFSYIREKEIIREPVGDVPDVSGSAAFVDTFAVMVAFGAGFLAEMPLKTVETSSGATTVVPSGASAVTAFVVPVGGLVVAILLLGVARAIHGDI